MHRLPIPPAAVLLVLAALASDVAPGIAPSVDAVEVIATIALVVILFDGGASIGVTRLRSALVPIASLGILGTFATAGLLTLFAHEALGLGWLTAGLIGAAIAPTDPAVMFSVLGERRIEGRTDTILEGESGANDPVGIALMLGLIELATHTDETFWVVVRVFAVQMVVGLAFGLAGGLLAARLLSSAYRIAPAVALGLAGVIFEVAHLAHGSGFLAVFIAGLLRGDVESPHEPHLIELRTRLASLAEVVVFVALGLTVDLTAIGSGRWADGLLLAAFAVLVARPLVAFPLLAPVRLDAGERTFVVWGGLKGAVPILLAAYAVTGGVAHAQRIYETVFVVVLASVVVQGGSLPFAARRLGVEKLGVEGRSVGE